MKAELTLEERDLLLSSMTAEQREFLHHTLVRGRRTVFAKQLANRKSQYIPDDASVDEIEAYLEEWDYIGFTDSGSVSEATRCECGRPLRYQHQVLHLPTGTTRYFGIDHLQLHTGIDAGIISAIQRGFDVLDAELNEVLIKYRDGWDLGYHFYQPFPAQLDIPRDIADQLDAGLPLLGRQIARLRTKLRELEQASSWERISQGSERVRQQLEYKSETETVVIDTASSQGMLLFEETDSELRERQELVRQGPFYLPPAAVRAINASLLPKTRISARALSEGLIEQKLIGAKRMSSGKPEAYIAVAAYLDTLTEQGKCRMLERTSEDRIYFGLD
ncbi:hypothetical protein FHS18_006482 [Paenibacillus phyllosphaerae]|uniref:Uncharacterized protein n=1 Tax=Paenibacillus phyllosphaerae TaxID=274593 RepID=A0A7W5B5K3_9BACL|nr:DUF3895 domain-containing protein [Paenibacillus phyllosphaerae]MBB3114361.1 hypothetical protein [Paenibacillus phyllosphaerae]